MLCELLNQRSRVRKVYIFIRKAMQQQQAPRPTTTAQRRAKGLGVRHVRAQMRAFTKISRKASATATAVTRHQALTHRESPWRARAQTQRHKPAHIHQISLKTRRKGRKKERERERENTFAHASANVNQPRQTVNAQQGPPRAHAQPRVRCAAAQ